jgi:hypothetical protein
MGSNAYVGLVLSSHSANNLSIATFTDVSVTSGSSSTLATDLADQDADVFLKGRLEHYPNPFESSFTLRVDGLPDETFELEVLESKGGQVLKEMQASCNVDHRLGEMWKPGLYFVRIQQGNKMITKKIVKTLE